MTVKRFDPEDWGGLHMKQTADGGWVLFEDYKMLREALHYALQAWQYDGVSDEHGSTFTECSRRCDE